MGNDALYVEIYHAILKSIQANEYPENSPLPSERYLCEKYHVPFYDSTSIESLAGVGRCLYGTRKWLIY